eukprot:TRINITY_DN14588_c0_g1_i3.p1 TRINITY_DN14588_c0_g1~~TRINITY_DN14588_c0_g1_i3.p1  ORF type:complete len:264 (+),score=23.79 TRINITY_DN14588_c0_g1_i3:76-867(+)
MDTYVGVVKSFDPNKGYGFATAPEIVEKYGKDIFLASSALAVAGFDTSSRPAVVGQSIRFVIRDGSNGKPVGCNVRRFLRGTIKSFDPAKQYGFVTSPETAEQYRKDVFCPGTVLSRAGLDVQDRRAVVGRPVDFLISVESRSGSRPIVDEVVANPGGVPAVSAPPEPPAKRARTEEALLCGPVSELPDGWEEYTSDEYDGRAYWHNSRTGETSWIKPSGGRRPTREVQAHQSADRWEEHHDPDFDRPYWYNPRTQESRWRPP